jgi:predicted DNA-binding transcriptional regulator AlpA
MEVLINMTIHAKPPARYELEDRKVRAREAAYMLGIGLTTFYDWLKQGRIQPGIRLNPRVIIWKKSTIQDFLDRMEQEQAAQEK